MLNLRSNRIFIVAAATLGLVLSAPVYADNKNSAPTNVFKEKNLQELLKLKNSPASPATPGPTTTPGSATTAPAGPPDLAPGLSVVVVIGKTDNPLAEGVLQLGPQNSTSVSADGCTFPWVYYVKNNGTGPTNQGFHSSLIVQRLEAGKSRILKVETNFQSAALSGGHASPVKGDLILKSGLYKLDVLVDRGNKVAEFDETNNRRGRTVQIAGGCGVGS